MTKRTLGALESFLVTENAGLSRKMQRMETYEMYKEESMQRERAGWTGRETQLQEQLLEEDAARLELIADVEGLEEKVGMMEEKDAMQTVKIHQLWLEVMRLRTLTVRQASELEDYRNDRYIQAILAGRKFVNDMEGNKNKEE